MEKMKRLSVSRGGSLGSSIIQMCGPDEENVAIVVVKSTAVAATNMLRMHCGNSAM